MPLGLRTGLGAALSWGTLDLLIALATRRVGSLRVTTWMQLIGAALVALVVVASGPAVPTDPFGIERRPSLWVVSAILRPRPYGIRASPRRARRHR